MISIVKPDDFLKFFDDFTIRNKASLGANLVLNNWLASEGVKVCGFKDSYNKEWLMTERSSSADTHQAILVCVKPMEKKKCEHGEEYIEILNGYWHCGNCKVRLKSKGWQEIEGD